MKVHVSAETTTLRTVIVGNPDTFLQVEPEIINETQRIFYFGPDRPTRAAISQQISGLISVLHEHGVTVHQPRPLSYVPDQLMTRDIGFVVDRTLVVTTMAAASRQREWRGIAYLFEQFDNANIIFTPEEFVLEGGDVIVDRGLIFVGVGQRTTPEGVDYMRTMFPDYKIVPVYLKQIFEGENVLHLDCSFLPVGDHYALFYPDGLREVPRLIRERYELIEVSRDEQQALATNVLSLSPTTVISRVRSKRVNELLRQRGIDVIEVNFADPPKTGGSFRCCTLPLLRE